MKRWILNKKSRTAHDRQGLTERCNTDQIRQRETADELPEGYRACGWCSSNRKGPVSAGPS